MPNQLVNSVKHKTIFHTIPHSPHPQNDETLNWVDFTKEGLKFLIKAML